MLLCIHQGSSAVQLQLGPCGTLKDPERAFAKFGLSAICYTYWAWEPDCETLHRDNS